MFPMFISFFARLFEGGECSFENLFDGPMSTFESNVAYPLRFMIDTKVSQNNCSPTHLTCDQLVGMNWVEVPAGKYKIVKQNTKSHCQLEIIMRLVHTVKILQKLI